MTRRWLFLIVFIAFLGSAFVSPPPASATYGSPNLYCQNRQTSIGSGNWSCSSVTGAACPTTGSLIVVSFTGTNYTSASINDDQGNSYSAAEHVDISGWIQGYIFFATAKNNNCPNINANPTSTTSFPSVLGTWYTSAGVNSLDVHTNSQFSSNSSTQSTGNVTTTQNDDLLYSTIICASTSPSTEFSAGSGYTSPGLWYFSNSAWFNEYRITTSAGAYAGSWADTPQTCLFGSGNGVILLAAFKDSSTASGTQIGGFLVGPMKWKPSGQIRPRQIPWDRPRRIFESTKI